MPSIFSFLKSQEVSKRKSSLEWYDRSLTLQAKRSKLDVTSTDQQSDERVEDEIVECPSKQVTCTDAVVCLSCVKLESEKDCLWKEVSEL